MYVVKRHRGGRYYNNPDEKWEQRQTVEMRETNVETHWEGVLRSLVMRNVYWLQWRKDRSPFLFYLEWTLCRQGWVEENDRRGWAWETWESSGGRLSRGIAARAWSSVRRNWGSAVAILLPSVWIQFDIFRGLRGSYKPSNLRWAWTTTRHFPSPSGTFCVL